MEDIDCILDQDIKNRWGSEDDDIVIWEIIFISWKYFWFKDDGWYSYLYVGKNPLKNLTKIQISGYVLNYLLNQNCKLKYICLPS